MVRATVEAVSALSTCSPSLTGWNPRLRANPYSLSVKSPSGPISQKTSVGGIPPCDSRKSLKMTENSSAPGARLAISLSELSGTEAQTFSKSDTESMVGRWERPHCLQTPMARPHSKSLSSVRFKVLRHGRTSLWLAGFGFQAAG